MSTLREDRNFRLLVATRLLIGRGDGRTGHFYPLCYQVTGLARIDRRRTDDHRRLFRAALELYLEPRYCRLFQAVSCVFLCSPLYANASSYAPDYRSDLPLPSGCDLKALLFVVAFILGAIATKGGFMGTTNYLLEIAPEDRRPSFMAFVRVLQASTVLMPLIAGSIAELYSFQAAFALAGAGGLGTFLMVYRLDEPRQIDHPAHPADSRS